jgi:hypothetical protein
VDGTACEVPFSAGNPTNNIKANPIGPDAVESMDGGFYNGLSGIALEYTGGEVCTATG